MAIPVGTKFIGIRPGVDLSERKSAFINELTEAYEVGDFTGTFTGTTDDITEGVNNLFVTQADKDLWNSTAYDIGTSGQIPFVNGTDDDLSYSSNLTYDGNLNIGTGRFISTLSTLSFVRLGQSADNTQEALFVKGYANKRYIAYFQNNNGNSYMGIGGRGGSVAATFTMDAASSDSTTTLLVKGSGSTSATTTFLLQNSSGTDLLKVRDDGALLANGITTLRTTTANRNQYEDVLVLQRYVTSPNPYNGNGSAILWKGKTYRNNNHDNPHGRIKTILRGDSVFNIGTDIIFENLRTDNATSLTESLRISYDGNVGIGTTSPTAKLQVVGSDNTTGVNTLLTSLDGTELFKINNYGQFTFRMENISSTSYIRNKSGATLFTFRNDSNRGLLRLHNGVREIEILEQGATAWIRTNTGDMQLRGAVNAIMHAESGDAIFRPNGTEIARFTSTGLGIGTTSPGKKLDVIGTVRSQMTPPGAGNGDVYGFNIHTFVGDNNRLGIGLHDAGDAFMALMNNTGVISRIDSNGDSYLMGGNVGIGTTTPDASSILDLTSTTKGFLPPRMTTTERDAIATPATGLLVYDTDEGVYNYFDGVSWTTMGLSLWQESGTNIYYDAGSVGVNTGGVNDAKFHVNGDGDNDSTVSFVVKSSLGNERFKVQDGGRFVHSSSSGSFIGYDDSVGNYKLNIKGTSGNGSYIWANGSNSLSIGNNGDIFIGRQNGISGPLSFSSVIVDNVWGRLIIGDTDTARNGNLRVRSGSNPTETINSVFTDNSENELMKILATGVVTVGYQGTTSSTSTLTTYANTLSTAKFVSTAASGAASGSDIAAVSDDGAAIASGDRLGGLLIGGSSDASHNLRSAVGVTGYATELWSGTQNGAKLNFEVTPNGSTSRSVAMTIDQNLNVGIGETSPLPIWGSGRVLCIKDVVNDEVEINFKTTTHSAMMSLSESVYGSYFTIGTDTLADFRISTNTTNRFAISSTGESAFNLANPSEATLQVNTHSDSKIAFLVRGSATASQDVFEVRVGASKELAVKSSGVLYYNQTPVESQATDSTHKVEVDLGGSTYYFLVTNV